MAYGRATLDRIGSSIELSADGQPEAKAIGATIAWGTVAAVAGADVTWADGVTVKVGERGLRYGQVLCRITTAGADFGKYGPFDPAAAGTGRDTLRRGECYLLNRSALGNEPLDEYPEAIEGGRVWRARLIQSGAGPASLAAGPLLADLLAAFPTLKLVGF